jgi:hypothetical protein
MEIATLPNAAETEPAPTTIKSRALPAIAKRWTVLTSAVLWATTAGKNNRTNKPAKVMHRPTDAVTFNAPQDKKPIMGQLPTSATPMEIATLPSAAQKEAAPTTIKSRALPAIAKRRTILTSAVL